MKRRIRRVTRVFAGQCRHSREARPFCGAAWGKRARWREGWEPWGMSRSSVLSAKKRVRVRRSVPSRRWDPRSRPAMRMPPAKKARSRTSPARSKGASSSFPPGTSPPYRRASACRLCWRSSAWSCASRDRSRSWARRAAPCRSGCSCATGRLRRARRSSPPRRRRSGWRRARCCWVSRSWRAWPPATMRRCSSPTSRLRSNKRRFWKRPRSTS